MGCEHGLACADDEGNPEVCMGEPPDEPDWDEWPGTAPGCAALCNCPACRDPLLVDLLWQHLPPEPDPDPTRPPQNESTD